MAARNDFPKAYYPFSDELCSFMDAHSEFLNSLKLTNKARFQFIPVIAITHIPETEPLTKDEIIGFFYVDKRNFRNNRRPFFKQDYIVNVGANNTEFISYSASKNNGQYVKPLRDFFNKYGNNGIFYHRNGTKPWHHHYDNLNDLPDFPGLTEAAREKLSII